MNMTLFAGDEMIGLSTERALFILSPGATHKVQFPTVLCLHSSA